MSDALVEKIEQWRFRRIEKPKLTTSGAVRDLITLALIKEGEIKKGDPLWQDF